MSFAVAGSSPYASYYSSPQKRNSQTPSLQFGAAFSVELQANPDCVPTPEDLTQNLIQLARIQPGMTVLEPSAGTGNIAGALSELPGVRVHVAEYDDELRRQFERQGYQVIGSDFLAVEGREGQYDRIVMNPPFSGGQYAQHIQKAYELLKPGGRIVVVIPRYVAQGRNGGAKQFQSWLARNTGWHRFQPVQAGTFLHEDTGRTQDIPTSILIIDKPDGKGNVMGGQAAKSKNSKKGPRFGCNSGQIDILA